MKHWEFESFVVGHVKLQAQETLSFAQAVALGMGNLEKAQAEKVWQSLFKQAGYAEEKPEVPEDKPKYWSDQLLKFLG